MLNPFFLQGSVTEQGLIQDLINEQLRMYGVEVYYIPRSYITQNTVIEELIESSFEDAYPIDFMLTTLRVITIIRQYYQNLAFNQHKKLI